LDEVKFKTDSGDRIDDGELARGMWVQVKGDWSEGNGFAVSRVKLLDDPDDWKHEVQGPVEEVTYSDSRILFRLPGVTVSADDETEFDGEWTSWKTDLRADGPADQDAGREDGRTAPLERVLTQIRLYDLRTDPEERSDLSEKAPDIVRRLHAELDAWEERHGRAAAEPVRTALDTQTLERLRSLGYVR
jgi:hypothetical protein